MSADNQQERLGKWLCHYIAGFVDGEGSSHVAVQKSKYRKIRYKDLVTYLESSETVRQS